MLEHIELFSTLSPAQLRTLSDRCVPRTFPKGAIIISEGDEGGNLFVLESGSVRVFVSDEAGNEFTLRTMGPGEYFGELSLFDDSPRSASVMAKERCRALVLQKVPVHDAARSDPDLALRLLKGACMRIRDLTESLRTQVAYDALGKLIRTLHVLAVDSEGVRIVAPRPKHHELAARIGATRETVGRILRELATGGYISLEPTRIVLLRKVPPRW